MYHVTLSAGSGEISSTSCTDLLNNIKANYTELSIIHGVYILCVWGVGMTSSYKKSLENSRVYCNRLLTNLFNLVYGNYLSSQDLNNGVCGAYSGKFQYTNSDI